MYENRDKEFNNAVINLVNVCVPIWILMFIGWLVGYLCLFSPNWRVPMEQLNFFMFFFGIPATAFIGLAGQSFPSLEWNFVLVFLVLRLIVGAICAVIAYLQTIYLKKTWKAFSIGLFLSHWIGSTWINTLIFGIPIMQTLYGPRVIVLNVLATISSLFFQLPIMLILFEIRGTLKAKKKKQIELINHHNDKIAAAIENGDISQTSIINNNNNNDNNDQNQQLEEQKHDQSSSLIIVDYSLKAMMTRTLIKLFVNPPLIGICLGLAYSGFITTLGHKTLIPYIIQNLCAWLGNMIQPLACFCIGLFVNGIDWKEAKKVFGVSSIYVIVKLILVPYLMVGLAPAFNIRNVEARAAVQISALPIAIASFILVQNYNLHINIQIICLAVIIGTILILPTAIFWEVMLDKLHGGFNRYPNPYTIPPELSKHS